MVLVPDFSSIRRIMQVATTDCQSYARFIRHKESQSHHYASLVAQRSDNKSSPYAAMDWASVISPSRIICSTSAR